MKLNEKNKDNFLVVDFDSLESLKSSIDKYSAFSLRCFFPESYLKSDFDNYHTLIDTQRYMLDKATHALNMLHVAIHMHENGMWQEATEQVKEHTKFLFLSYGNEFTKLDVNYAKQRAEYRKEIINTD